MAETNITETNDERRKIGVEIFYDFDPVIDGYMDQGCLLYINCKLDSPSVDLFTQNSAVCDLTFYLCFDLCFDKLLNA